MTTERRSMGSEGLTAEEIAAMRHRDREWSALRPTDFLPLWSRERLADAYFVACLDRKWLLAHIAAQPVAGEGLHVERLMVAVFNADSPGDWPKWDDYIAAFGSAGTPPWRRKAEKIAAEYAALQPASEGEGIDG